MSGEKNLELLLKNAEPFKKDGLYVFCSTKVPKPEIFNHAVVTVKEEEGLTLVLPKEIADVNNIPYEYIASWITLKVHSSLSAVGLTAAFSKALANEGISCNVVAGYYHDHIFLDHSDTEKALNILSSL